MRYHCWLKSQESKAVVRAKVPWENNIHGLIAVLVDVENVVEGVEKETEERIDKVRRCYESKEKKRREGMR